MEENTNAVSFPLIGDAAPAFKAVTTNGDINFPADFTGQWVILFSHPSDFTPVCTTEFMTFASLAEEFKELNCALLGLSVDSLASHIAWLRTIEKLEWKHIKHVKVRFPLIADIRMDVANKYGMIQPNFSTTAAVRAVFVVDPKGIVRTVLYYPGSLGRNFDEIKRILIGLQKADAEACATPADWRPGDDVILPIPGTMDGAEKRAEDPGEDAYCLDWFLCFRKDRRK
ncbi:MAG: peroxiredoxin [Oscillospiraceae bacterium]|jgi:peroxiredoxin (alkyl hydroperoxide reductase subunit C)|nr:peroxiredoxin [Oscillospiraceae bacterium]